MYHQGEKANDLTDCCEDKPFTIETASSGEMLSHCRRRAVESSQRTNEPEVFEFNERRAGMSTFDSIDSLHTEGDLRGVAGQNDSFSISN